MRPPQAARTSAFPTIVRLEDPDETPLVKRGGTETYAGTQATLQQVALHEIGRVLGFTDDADPHSVMFPTSTGENRNLDGTDIAGGGLLYGLSPEGRGSSTSPTTRKP